MQIGKDHVLVSTLGESAAALVAASEADAAERAAAAKAEMETGSDNGDATTRKRGRCAAAKKKVDGAAPARKKRARSAADSHRMAQNDRLREETAEARRRHLAYFAHNASAVAPFLAPKVKTLMKSVGANCRGAYDNDAAPVVASPKRIVGGTLRPY